MRRFLTLLCMLCLAIPAGISISGCTRNPGAEYCNGEGYGLKITDVASITLQPATTGISMAFGQTHQSSAPTAVSCKGTGAVTGVNGFTYGTTNSQFVDISPTGNICAGTWNRNTGGGIADYTICSPPNPLPLTGGLPYATAFITASAQSVTSNPVEVYVHAPVTSVSLVTTPTSGSPQQCLSQGIQATLDAQACNANASNQQVLLCAPASVTSANRACPLPPTPLGSTTFSAPPPAIGNIVGASYTSGGTITGTAGKTCLLSGFNNGSSGATAWVYLTGTNTIANGTSFVITAGGAGATSAPTTATLSSGTATSCSGTATITSSLGPIAGTAGQTCNLSNFNNGTTGTTATVALTGANTIASGTPLVITANGNPTLIAPTTATLSNGSAYCSGTATISSTLTPVPNCTASIGVLSYTVGTSSVASIATNTTTNQVTITAEQPGTTLITASVAGSGSSAGYFSTCPPKSISVTLADGATSGTITQGVTQNLITTAYDTNNNPINGLNLSYQSTDPIDISAASTGYITTNFPGKASIYAVCQAPNCNPSPLNVDGLYGTGLPVTSNPVTVTTPGTSSDYVWFAAPGQSQYFVSVDLHTGTAGTAQLLPYVPNSMVMNRLGNVIFFGSAHELMIYTASNVLNETSVALPGVVLGVAPDDSGVLINDQVRHLFYLYSFSKGTTSTYSGMGNAAAWTPDAATLYATDSAALNNAAEGITGHTDTLYVYNANTGWITYPLQPSPLLNPPLPPGVLSTPLSTLPPNVAFSSTAQTPAILIPSVGAYLRGSPTEAYAWCPTGNVGNYASMDFYPLGDSADVASDGVDVQSDALVATTDGQHILGAAVTASGTTLSDLDVTIPQFNCLPPDFGSSNPLAVGDALSPLSLTHTLNQMPLSINATAINQVVASPESDLAFVTYTAAASNTNATLPYYVPGSAPGYVTLTGGSAVIAPLAGAFTPDDKTFFVSTAGDNKIHYIDVPTLTDTQQISPNLPACKTITDGGSDPGCVGGSGNGSTVPATAIAVKPHPVS